MNACWSKALLLALAVQGCTGSSAQMIVPFATEWRYNQGGTNVVFGLQLATVAPPILSTQPTNQVVARTYNATFAVSSSNETLLAYQWRKDGTDIPGANDATYTI